MVFGPPSLFNFVPAATIAVFQICPALITGGLAEAIEFLVKV
jgi:hypothetical protein